MAAAAVPQRLHELYEEQALQSPDAPALVCWGPALRRAELSFAELVQRSRVLAAGLRSALAAACLEQDPSTWSGGPAAIVAAQVPRTHADFLPLLVAFSRCDCPFVLLSTDLLDIALQDERNTRILKELRPCLLVIARAQLEQAPRAGQLTPRTIAVEAILDSGSGVPENVGCTGPGAAELCFLYTGGTTRGRCVAVTHEMVRHERAHYSECLSLAPAPRVLANTSVYWGASALGQLSIALAYGGCAVLCEAADSEAVRAAIAAERADVLGLVPDQLRVLSGDPARELPDMRAVFTWGEALPLAVAELWRGHPKAKLRNLLISTEYWLSLYAAPLEDGGLFFRAVGGVRALVLTEEGRPASEGGVGELLLAGPMVTPGYVALSAEDSAEPWPFREIDGVRFFCTRDLVRLVSAGRLEFRGRADMTTKEKGKWVDLLAVEEAVRAVEGVAAAAIVPDPHGGPAPHAFLQIAPLADCARAVSEVRACLPRRAQVHVLASMPRHPVTQKVDLKRLRQLVAGARGGAWPLVPDAPAPPRLEGRLRAKLRRHLRWSLVAASAAAVWDVQALLHALCWRSGRGRRGGWPTGAGFLLLPLMQLACLHATARWAWVERLLGRLPLGMWGAILAGLAGRGLATEGSRLRRALGGAVAVWAACGAAWALRRRRFLAHPVVFWAGIGHRLEFDCGRWLRLSTWTHYLRERLGLGEEEVPDAAASPNAREERAARGARAGVALSCGRCRWSGRQVTAEWPPPDLHAAPPNVGPVGGACDGQGEAVSWQCWPVESAAALNEAAELAQELLERRPPDAARGHGPQPRREPEAEPEEAGTAAPTRSTWEEGERPEGPGQDGWRWSPQELARWKGRYDRWWYTQRTSDAVEVDQVALASFTSKDEEGKAGAVASSPDASGDPWLRRLCTCLSDVVGGHRFRGPDFQLHGLDSLCIGLATTRLRAEFAVPGLSALSVRRAACASDLLEDIRAAAHVPAPVRAVATAEREEYAVYFSPGQYFPMGGWVLRNDARLDTGCLEEAARNLVDRHVALRTKMVDPLRLLSFCLDTGILFGFVARMLDRGPWLARAVRRLLTWALQRSWPRLSVASRASLYKMHAAKAPFEVIHVGGQIELESAAKQRRFLLGEADGPLDIACVQVEVQLVGLWVYGQRGGEGDFAILPRALACGPRASQDSAAAAAGCEHIFCDRGRRKAGVLVGPGDPRWRTPPPGFPALLCADLSPHGGVVWLRVLRQHEVVVLHGASHEANTQWHRCLAFRMPGTGSFVTPSVFNFLFFHAMHSVADGQSYEAIVGDFVALYASLAPRHRGGASGGQPALPAVGNGLAELERRLFGALGAADPAASPQQCSLRGGIFRFRGRGYGHRVVLRRGCALALQRVRLRYGAPPDVVLLALTAASIARAGGDEVVPLTLYSASRDGPGEASLVGLFSDWRDLEVSTDRGTATVLGVVLEVASAVRERQWSLFNALRKPEATMVNFQLLDAAPLESRAGFVQVGEDAWRQGEWLGRSDTRRDTQPVLQPLSITIEQQDRETWCVHFLMGCESHPPAWARRFVRAFQDAFAALVKNPTERVHRPYPEDFY